MSELDDDQLRSVVRARYAKVAERAGCGGGSRRGGCCAGDAHLEETARLIGYTDSEVAAAPIGSNLGLGCGNPTAIASLRHGQAVLDLGSGAGFDAFLAAKAVGPDGRVIGVDMTPEMISKARANLAKGGYQNVEFRLGEIEDLPVADASVEVIISNCVINLSPRKPRVFGEAFRVLKPGGRLAIADVVALRPIPDELRDDRELYTGCVSGASMVDDLKRMLQNVGFTGIRIKPAGRRGQVVSSWFPGQGVEQYVASATIEALKPEQIS